MSAGNSNTVLGQIDQYGYAIIPEFLSNEQLEKAHQLYDDMLGSFHGRNNFEGNQTERIYTLLARDKLFQDVAEDARIMALCNTLLMPNYLLTASQAIVIGPGETPQPWHADDSFYPIPRPRPMISFSTIVALDEFTHENGGTQVIPGSHRWDDEKIGGYYSGGELENDPHFAQSLQKQAIPITMAAGSCMVFSGTLLHRGGANNSQSSRRAFSNQYCQPWARTQENFFLAIPQPVVAQMSPTVQSLLGYSIHPPFMGQITASHPQKALQPDWVPPAFRV